MVTLRKATDAPAPVATTTAHTIGDGSLVTVDLFRAPLLPGKIRTVRGDGRVDVVLTADRGTYRRGEVLTGLKVHDQVVARAQVVRSRTRTGHYAIRGTAVLAPLL